MPEPAYASYDAAYEMEAAEVSGFGMSNGSAKDESQESAPETNPEKIIYSADATVETTEFDKSVAALEAMIEKEIGNIPKEKVQQIVRERLVKIEQGDRDFRF